MALRHGMRRLIRMPDIRYHERYERYRYASGNDYCCEPCSATSDRRAGFLMWLLPVPR